MILPVFAALLAGCTSIWRVAHPPLRVGVSPQFPPLVFAASNQFAGVEIDFARALGKELGRDVRFVTVKWSDQLPTLLVNETDIVMSGLTALAARPAPAATNLTNAVAQASHDDTAVKLTASKAAFTTPYLANDLYAVSRVADVAKFAAAMADTSAVRKISANAGFLEGSTAEAAVKREFPMAKRVEFRTRAQALSKLQSGEIDLFVDEGYALAANPPAKESGLAILPRPVASDPLVWAVRPGAKEFQAEINEILKRWIANGTRDRIVKRWMPNSRTTP